MTLTSSPAPAQGSPTLSPVMPTMPAEGIASASDLKPSKTFGASLSSTIEPIQIARERLLKSEAKFLSITAVGHPVGFRPLADAVEVDLTTVTLSTTPSGFREILVTNTEWAHDFLLNTNAPCRSKPIDEPVLANYRRCSLMARLYFLGYPSLGSLFDSPNYQDYLKFRTFISHVYFSGQTRMANLICQIPPVRS